MDCITDAKICIQVSDSMLKNIEKIYNESLLNDSMPSTLKVTIKNFLENIRSSLEYITNYVFYTYCAKNYTGAELKRKKVYFPIRKDKNYFNKCINKDFRGLRESNPEIYKILEKCQAFNGNMWTSYLADLCNKNKHINLTKHRRTESGHIEYMSDIHGNIFQNCTFINCKHGIVYNNTPIYDSNNPYIKSFEGYINIEYLFEEINQPILLVINDIYNGAVSVIDEFEKIL
ncbi:hypothetical protein [Inconstantimicrobium mannanitabidum]|uniref:Uncharacterized protein n=1 Tax=Inconstantimicrobium mannanitabidum TaxID=1604901 RepID=A0ACB5RAF0_9CLOT|nr:hypothetical protein [Clostridium sp. TW13]GKX65844.1 hypothetical protein rsdtw13_11020 [Clostridium sp. TW13]